MYGLKDAGAAFDKKELDVTNLMGVSVGKFNISVGYKKTHVICRDECFSEKNTARLVQMVRLVRWGYHFSLSGRRLLCSTFRDDMGKHLLVKTTAVLRPNVEMGNVQEAIHLKKLVRLYPSGAEGDE